MTHDLPSIIELTEKGAKFEVKEFPKATRKGAIKVAKAFKMNPRPFIKTLVFEGSSKEMYLVMVGADQEVDNTLLAKAVDEDSIELTDPERIKDELGYVIGSIPAFGLKTDIKKVIDESLKSEATLGTGAGEWGIEIFIAPDELIKGCGAEYKKFVKEVEQVDYTNHKLEKENIPQIKSASELDEAILLKDIKDNLGEEINLHGWVYNVRGSGKIKFLQFRDGSGDIQAIVEKPKVSEEVWENVCKLTIESSLQISGIARADERSPFGFEMDVTSIKIIQIAPEYPIGKKEHGPAFLMDNRHLWLRSSKQRAVIKIRDEVFFSLTKFLREDGFTRIDTPIFQPVSCEDTSELFEVDYFGDKTYLTQSGQLYCEAAEFGLGRTYDFGPVFRAEKSKTRKHLVEFWMMDAELPFTTLEGLMDFEEKMMKTLISDCLKNCAYELKILERDTTKLQHYLDNSFIRLSHKEVIEMLNEKFDMGLDYLDDIGAPEEEKLAELYDVPVFITDWPEEIKAFYMSKSPQIEGDLKRVRAVDLVAPEGAGEICGGSERIFDYNELIKKLEEHNYPWKDYEWYMDLRKYGSIPHAGFGIGLERAVRWISGAQHIRETIPFARMINRMYP